MKGIVIDGAAKSLEPVELTSEGEIAEIVGFDSVISDEISPGEVVFFDEDCFIRGTEGRFQIDALPPIAGKAVVLGLQGDGVPADTTMDIQALQARLKFL